MNHHWDEIYSSREVTSLGWYQKEPQPDLGIIESLHLPLDASIVIAGAGATTLVDHLVAQGYTNMYLTDISSQALQTLKDRIGPNPYTWIVDDLTCPSSLKDLPKIDLWYDRAVLHFFTTNAEQQAYARLIRSKIRNGGHVILAEFSTSGAVKCSGLPVRRYDPPSMQTFLGSNFASLHFLDFTYIQPSGGIRPFLYGVFQNTS